ncbi:MAG: hypothetical protein PHD35_12580 [Synergistaceae bacterium]|nr:hypothetical protein [Synergistaceae bacterium]
MKKSENPVICRIELEKVPSDPQKQGSRPPKILTTGRWICRKCLNYVAQEARVCRCCGGESFTVEWDAKALSEVFQRDAERIKTRMERRV